MPEFRNVERTHGYEALRVEGSVPRDLRGALFRAGPGLMERFGERLTHPFEADGAITSVRFDEGGAFGACEVVKGQGYLDEERAGVSLHGSRASWPRRFMNAMSRKTKATGNTSLMDWQGRLFALMEGAPPQELDSTTLETLGLQTFGEMVTSGFSAHPRRCPDRRTTFNFGVRYDLVASLELFAFPDEGQPRMLGKIRAPWPGLVHDFALTERYMIFLIGPAKLVMWRAMLGLKDFTRYFRWHADESARLLIVPIDEPARFRTLELDACWVWHFANAFERGDEIVIDAIRHDDFSSFSELNEDTLDRTPTLHRYRVHGSSIREERLSSLSCEFPSVRKADITKPYQDVWLQTDDAGQFGIAKVNTRTGEEEHFIGDSNWTGSEPLLVSTQEGDYVLSMIDDGARTFLGIFNASAIGRGPRARVFFDHRVPPSFHGVFRHSVRAGDSQKTK